MRSRVYVLAQATKHASTHCVCKLHSDLRGEQFVQNFATYTRTNAVFTQEPHERATCSSRGRLATPGLLFLYSRWCELLAIVFCGFCWEEIDSAWVKTLRTTDLDFSFQFLRVAPAAAQNNKWQVISCKAP